MRKYRDRVPVADADPFATSRPTPDVPYDRPWLIAQWKLEEILRTRLVEYGVQVELSAEVTGLKEGPDSVTASLADGRNIEAQYVVGCDGGHSAVRKLLGIPFEGQTNEEQAMVCGDVEVDGLDRGYWHQWFDEDGAVMLCPIPGTRSDWWFQAGPETDASGAPVPPSLESFHAALRPAHRTRRPPTCRTPPCCPRTGSMSEWSTATGWAVRSWPATPRMCTRWRAVWA